MFKRLQVRQMWVLSAAAVCLGALAVASFWGAPADSQAEEPAGVSPLVAPAKQAYQVSAAAYNVGTVDMHELYRWSRLWMEAELQGNPDAKQAQAAKDGHMKRMSQLHAGIKALFDEGVRGGEAEKYYVTQYYMAEAKLIAGK